MVMVCGQLASSVNMALEFALHAAQICWLHLLTFHMNYVSESHRILLYVYIYIYIYIYI